MIKWQSSLFTKSSSQSIDVLFDPVSFPIVALPKSVELKFDALKVNPPDICLPDNKTELFNY